MGQMCNAILENDYSLHKCFLNSSHFANMQTSKPILSLNWNKETLEGHISI